MTDTAIAPAKTPWHVWVVGVLGLLWNGFGVFDYLMTRTNNGAYLAAFTPEQREYFAAMPMWAVTVWTIGVWGALIGSVLILLRSRYTWMFLLVSLAGFLASLVYSYVLSDARAVMGDGTVMSLVIAVILVLQLWYAWTMTKRGVLR